MAECEIGLLIDRCARVEAPKMLVVRFFLDSRIGLLLVTHDHILEGKLVQVEKEE